MYIDIDLSQLNIVASVLPATLLQRARRYFDLSVLCVPHLPVFVL